MLPLTGNGNTYLAALIMPTRNPRVNVCVSFPQHDLLTRLAHLQGCSAASLVKAMIDAAEPIMRKTLVMMEAAEDAKGLTQKAARDALRDVLEELRGISGDTDQLDLLNLLTGAPSGEPAAPPANPSGIEDGAADPPSSNTGVRYPDLGMRAGGACG